MTALDRMCPRLQHRLGRPGDVKVEELPRVGADPIGDLGGCQTASIAEFWVELDAVLHSGEIFAEDPPAEAMAEPVPDPFVVLRAPGQLSGPRGHGGIDRATGAWG